MAAEKINTQGTVKPTFELDSAIEKRMNSRFREISDSEIYEFVESMKNQNTQMKTNSDLKKIHLWLESVGEQRSRKHPLKRIGPVSSPILPECQQKE